MYGFRPSAKILDGYVNIPVKVPVELDRRIRALAKLAGGKGITKQELIRQMIHYCIKSMDRAEKAKLAAEVENTPESVPDNLDELEEFKATNPENKYK